MMGLSAQTRRVWAAPVLIAVAMLASLIGALVAEDVFDWVAALLLFAVLAYTTVLGLQSRSS